MDKAKSYTTSSEIFDIADNVAAEMSTVESTSNVFDGSKKIEFGTAKKKSYAKWGDDDQLPYQLQNFIGGDEVMSQNKLFNVLTCYGSGLRYLDSETKQATQNAEVKRFMFTNNFPLLMLEQSTDIKYYFFAVAVVLLNEAGTKIVQVRHKDAAFCRLCKANKFGKLDTLLFGDFSESVPTDDKIEVIPLLDEINPLDDLETRIEEGTKDRKFAVIIRFPTAGRQYYPTPYYTAIFRGDWYDIKKLIGKGKKAKLKHHAPIKYQVEINQEYWDQKITERGLASEEDIAKMIKAEKERIKAFIGGIENSGKVWITGYFVDPNGTENKMVRINVIDTKKEGGDWSEDIQEASNMACYCDNVHPNLVGATPGKSQSNNSGSDKRELFTLKQSLEIGFHDLMLNLHWLIIYFNKWDNVEPDVPMITLTTLDKNKDAQVSTAKSTI